jgi:hypothetical protein
MRSVFGILALLLGVLLALAPFHFLGGRANAAGDGGPNFIPAFKALCSLGGSVVAFLVAWFLLKRRI